VHELTEASRPRALATALHRAAVEGAAPFPRTRDAVHRWRTGVGSTAARVHILAMGKAAASMAAGALDALAGTQATVVSAIVVTSHAPSAAELGPRGTLPDMVELHLGDHPVPGPASLDAADAIGDAVIRVEPGDHVLVLLSGGTTALTAAPTAALSQQVGDAGRAQAHIANLAQTLLESGLAIHEMNAIRRRVLRWGAGRLAVALHARGAAHIAVLAISDVIGDAPEVIGSGPCSPDPLDDTALYALLDAHHLRSALERDMAQFLGLEGGGAPPSVPSPDHPAFAHVHYEYVARNRDAVAALAEAARAAGITQITVDDTPLEGEASELGDEIARRALRTAEALPRDQRAIWIAGGEPVVHLRSTVERALELDDSDGSPDEPMKGGRMQALALSAAMRLEERARDVDDFAWRITVLAAGTDGRDGPTDAAGAIVDCGTPLDARRFGRRRPERDLATGRSWFSLDAAGALLRTGPTGTNVMDVVAVLIESR
jgi:glycerate 2-kinase